MKVSVIHKAFETTSRLVAIVDAPDSMSVNEALEYAYHRTQNLGGSWSRGETFEFAGETHQNPDYSEDVTVMADLPVREGITYGLRSTSMDDRMIIGKSSYTVAMMGFEKEEV